MRLQATVLTLTLAVGLWGAAAQAQTLKAGGLSGPIVTQSVLVPQNCSMVVFTTPAPGSKGGFFVLTQVCVEDGGDMELSGSSVGRILLDDDCQTFTPGLAIPQGETLTFTETRNNSDQVGMITGVMSKK